MRLITVLVLLFVMPFFLKVSTVSAQIKTNVPLPNNYFGIHIIDEHDLDDAAKLVNSNGGEWGYVTVVIREDERDAARWTTVFNRMKDLKLIPIIRLATSMQNNGSWSKPAPDQATAWADFLNALPWPNKDRYMILFNEPNHKKEWGGDIMPEEYAAISRHYWEEFKKVNPEFSVLPAALDLAAPNSQETMNATDYYERMYKADEFIFTIFDAWNSHSYPNPGFSGSPFDTGKMSIRGFEWELNHLSQYNLDKETPVFITETGWKNSDNADEYYKIAFEQVWKHPNIRAVTPFLLNYAQAPFGNFSWKDPITNTYRPQYETIQQIPKTAGSPGV